MPTIKWSRAARDDVAAIGAYLRENASPEVALEQLIAIRARLKLLEQFPLAGPVTSDAVRKLSLRGTSHVALYQVVKGDVLIIRIAHNRSDRDGKS